MIRWLKIVLFIACLVPLANLAWKFFGPHPLDMNTWGAGLGANPTEALEHGLGDWTLRLLLVTLSITPLRKLLHLPALIKFRRMLGLFAFFYGCLHFTTYLCLDKFFNVHEILADIVKRKYITVGFAAWILLLPLAITSTTGWIRRLGGKRWQALHRLIYIAAVLGVIHYLWLVKADIREPLKYGAWLTLLLTYRLLVWALPTLRSRRVVPGPVKPALE